MEKEYLVRVAYGPVAHERRRRPFRREQLARLRHGLSLDGQPLKPAKVDWQNAEQLRFVLSEGKKRQIRRMCELVGLKVVGLKRIRIGAWCWGTCRRGNGGIWGRTSGSRQACGVARRHTYPCTPLSRGGAGGSTLYAAEAAFRRDGRALSAASLRGPRLKSTAGQPEGPA